MGGTGSGARPYVFTERQYKDMERRFRRGESLESLARRYGVTGPTIRDHLRRRGVEDVFRGKTRGPRHGQWKGGRIVDSNGYVRVWADPADPIATAMANTKRQVLEHRLVMARKLGRPLTRSETVHHKNGNRADNRLRNLQLRQGRHGNGVALCCAKCGSTELRPLNI